MSTQNKQSNQPRHTRLSKWIKNYFIPYYTVQPDKYLCNVIASYKRDHRIRVNRNGVHPIYTLQAKINSALKQTGSNTLGPYLSLYTEVLLLKSDFEWDKLNR